MSQVFQKMTVCVAIMAGAGKVPAQPATPTANAAESGAWEQLPSVPDPEGFASPFAGVSNGALIVTGGANFPNKRPWEGGTKVYNDRIFVLERPDGEWRLAGKLHSAIAYGVSIDVDQGLLCIGGNGDKGSSAECFVLEWVNGEIEKTDWPALPAPLTMAAGARLGSTIFVACGNAKDDAGKDAATTSLWSLDLSEPKPTWRKREDLPGPPRSQPTAAVQGAFFIFSGIGTSTGADGKSKVDYLKDAYRYTPNGATGKWERVADLPHPNAASPSPAPALGKTKILMLGEGAQGKNLDIPMQDRPLMKGDSIAYDVKTNTWQVAAPVPFGTVCSPVVQWNGRLVVANGEVRGGVRTPKVWIGSLPSKD